MIEKRVSGLDIQQKENERGAQFRASNRERCAEGSGAPSLMRADCACSSSSSSSSPLRSHRVSLLVWQSVGAQHCLVGHSERRTIFNNDDAVRFPQTLHGIPPTRIIPPNIPQFYIHAQTMPQSPHPFPSYPPILRQFRGLASRFHTDACSTVLARCAMPGPGAGHGP